MQNTAKQYILHWRKSHKTITRCIRCSISRLAWTVLYFLSTMISNTFDRYLSARTSKCGGRAENPDVANQWGPCHTGVSQQRTQGRAELQMSRQGHNAPVLVRSDGCNRVNSWTTDTPEINADRKKIQSPLFNGQLYKMGPSQRWTPGVDSTRQKPHKLCLLVLKEQTRRAINLIVRWQGH